LTGGEGADTFVFDLKDDTDIIFDFEAGLDILEFSGAMAATTEEAMTYASLVDGDVVFDFGTVVVIVDGVTSMTGLVDDIHIA